jgi:hypothetical protein
LSKDVVDQNKNILETKYKDINDTEKDYGVFIFTSPHAEENYIIQTALLRCLGDE